MDGRSLVMELTITEILFPVSPFITCECEFVVGTRILVILATPNPTTALHRIGLGLWTTKVSCV
jgi:hypothetical protein